MSTNYKQSLSIHEKARMFIDGTYEDRTKILSDLSVGDAAALRELLPESVVTGWVSACLMGKQSGPFNEPLPSDCQTGFGTYAPNKDHCFDCSLSALCYARKNNRVYEAVQGGIEHARNELRDAQQKAAATLAGRRAKHAYRLDYYSDVWAQPPYACDASALLNNDGSLCVPAFSAQISGGVKGQFTFTPLAIQDKTTGAQDTVHVLSFPFHRLFSERTDTSEVCPWRFAEIEGENKKMLFADFFEMCKENGDPDSLIVWCLFFAHYGAFVPKGWIYRFDASMVQGPRYVWSQQVRFA